jgi:transposase
LVTNHRTGKIIWGTEGKDTAAADRFFAELGTPRSKRIKAVSMDMAPAYRRSVETWEHAPYAKIVYDPFHVVQLATDALDQVRRRAWNEMNSIDKQAARMFRGARWSLMKNPDTLDDRQAAQLRQIRRRGGEVWRAYALKEALRGVFDRSLEPREAVELLDRFCDKAQRSRMQPFVKVAKTIRAHRFGIVNGLHLGLSNARAEALNNKVRLIVRRAYGFHSARAALALVLLACGPVTLRLPHERSAR